MKNELQDCERNQLAQQKRWLIVPRARDSKLKAMSSEKPDSWEAGFCVKLFNCLNQQCQDGVESMGGDKTVRETNFRENDISNLAQTTCSCADVIKLLQGYMYMP